MFRLLTDAPVRYPCSLLWATDFIRARPALQAIATRWQAIDGATSRCDRELAASSLATLFEHAGLRPPAICWWDSPVAMRVAHDIRVTLPTFASSLQSSELAGWLQAAAPNSLDLGPMVDAQALCTAFRDAAVRPTVDSSATPWNDAPLLAAWADTLRDTRDIEHGIRAALGRSSHQRATRRYCERTIAELWPGELAFDLLCGQFAAALGDPSILPVVLNAAVDLICNVHLALLCEGECWLCDRPIATDYGVVDHDGTIGCARAIYADGTTIAIESEPVSRG